LILTSGIYTTGGIKNNNINCYTRIHLSIYSIQWRVIQTLSLIYVTACSTIG